MQVASVNVYGIVSDLPPRERQREREATSRGAPTPSVLVPAAPGVFITPSVAVSVAVGVVLMLDTVASLLPTLKEVG